MPDDGLWDWTPNRVGTIQERFEEWLATDDGIRVYDEFVERALRLRHRGWTHYGHKAIIETIRYDWSVRVGPDAGGFKINDHHTSRLVRLVMDKYPELEGFFETRELRS